MAKILRSLISTYNYVNYDLSDPRSHQYYIITNPLIMTAFSIMFYKFVYNWGPKFMENRKPFKLERVIIIYNIFQILISIYIFVKNIALVWWTGYYDFICQPLNWEDTPIEREINSLIRLYYLVKILDLMDTIFFVLRKRNKQVSFLHVYHHISMIFCGFMALKYIPGGHGTMLGTVNTAVHAVMYSYYLLTSINPSYKKNIWWKKYITQLQIGQFLFLLIHFGRILFQPSCTYPKWICLAFIPQNLFMLAMFSDFYIKNYIMKKSSEKL